MDSSRAKIIEAMLPQARGNARAMVHLAEMLRAEGQRERMIDLCFEILALPSSDREAAIDAQRLLSKTVPSWHFSIVRDQARNDAYEQAMLRAIRPGMRVLEIGAGTGILAMMAARAGAEVVTCEMNRAVARAAAEVVAHNGYADRVRVIAKHSDDLDLDADLGGRRADILVSEIVSNDVLGEEVLRAHERAVRDLLVPGGRVIPAAGAARVALADDPVAVARLGEVSGFDLSPFNRLSRIARVVPRANGRPALRSAPADLFAFDFSTGAHCPPARTAIEVESLGGRVTGVAQWLMLHMDETADYEASPDAERCAWAVMFHPLAESIETIPGQIVRIHGAHDRVKLTIWAEPV